MKFRLHKMTN